MLFILFVISSKQKSAQTIVGETSNSRVRGNFNSASLHSKQRVVPLLEKTGSRLLGVLDKGADLA